MAGPVGHEVNLPLRRQPDMPFPVNNPGLIAPADMIQSPKPDIHAHEATEAIAALVRTDFGFARLIGLAC